MKIAVRRMSVQQVSMDTYKEFYDTKIFDESATIKEIMEWGKTKFINSLDFSDVEE